MEMPSLPERIEDALKEASEAREEELIVAKTFKAKKEWLKSFEELNILKDELKHLERKHETKRTLFWSTIETELGVYGKSLRFDDEKKIVELREEK